MRNTVIENIKERFKAYDELATYIDDTVLKQNTNLPKNKDLANHFWCVIGARESYTKAIETGAWSGFACSIKEVTTESIVISLENSKEGFDTVVSSIENWSHGRDQMLINLLEHETMHEGQIIRHMYALGYEVPKSFKWA